MTAKKMKVPAAVSQVPHDTNQFVQPQPAPPLVPPPWVPLQAARMPPFQSSVPPPPVVNPFDVLEARESRQAFTEGMELGRTWATCFAANLSELRGHVGHSLSGIDMEVIDEMFASPADPLGEVIGYLKQDRPAWNSAIVVGFSWGVCEQFKIWSISNMLIRNWGFTPLPVTPTP